MEFATSIFLAFSLAMDAFSVCVASGVKIKQLTFRHYFRFSFHFGLFQFLMPIIGYQCGVSIERVIRNYDHWIAFILLSSIGLKMIWESFNNNSDLSSELNDPSRGLSLIMLSIATSIDAAAVGFSFAALNFSIFYTAVIIGIVCTCFSAVGLYIGKTIGSITGIWAERFGGFILIIIGIKILIQHLYD